MNSKKFPKGIQNFLKLEKVTIITLIKRLIQWIYAKALKQINDKGYAEKYQATGKLIRNIVGAFDEVSKTKAYKYE